MTSASSAGSKSLHAQKGQPQLFTVPDLRQSSLDISVCAQQESSKRGRLATLLESELNFHGENGNYASHHLHAFAARFPPQLPRAFIRGLTSPGEVVLDPMMGSGTTVVEAWLEGRRGVGLDIDPLALRLCQVKTTPLRIERLQKAADRIVSRAYALARAKTIEQRLAQRFDERTKAFVDYWFPPTTQREIMALVLAIASVSEASVHCTAMQAVLAEMYRVLRDDSAAVVVVGPSVMRNINVQTHHCLADIAAELGFDVVGVIQRILDRNKRMMPARFGKKSDSVIEQRMHEEYVIGLLKPLEKRSDVQ